MEMAIERFNASQRQEPPTPAHQRVVSADTILNTSMLDLTRERALEHEPGAPVSSRSQMIGATSLTVVRSIMSGLCAFSSILDFRHARPASGVFFLCLSAAWALLAFYGDTKDNA